MKFYEITIKPTTSFGTPLKGDTIFGHFCWQAAYDQEILKGGLALWLGRYGEQPCVIFSSAFPKFFTGGRAWYAMKRPDLPLSLLFPGKDKDMHAMIRGLKEKKRLRWMRVESDLTLDLSKAQYHDDSFLSALSFPQARDGVRATMRSSPTKGLCINFDKQQNTINRATMTTGGGMFSPYTVSELSYYPETELSIFCLIDEEATDIEHVSLALKRIGQFGFGRDASAGSGKFQLGKWDETGIPHAGSSDACYALSPLVPEQDTYGEAFFSPFIRFGRHGDVLAKSSNPYKNPVIMADEGAVLVPKDCAKIFKRPYIGTALTGLSKAEAKTVQQGYAIYLPLKIGGLP